MTEEEVKALYERGQTDWDAFLQAWPLARLEHMTVEEYTKVGSHDTLAYWLEFKLKSSGNITGGSAFKFGIFSRKSLKEPKAVEGLSYSADYGWYTQYGASSEDAFRKVRTTILTIARAAAAGDYETVEKATFGDTLKWKIAFVYQERAAPGVIGVFTKAALAAFLGASPKDTSFLTLYQDVLKQRQPNEGVLQLGFRVWGGWAEKNVRIWKLSHGHNTFSVEQMGALKKQRLAVAGRELGPGQGTQFVDLPIGTLFYLCHGNGMQLLARFTSGPEDTARGPEYAQRHYEVLKNAIKNDAIENKKKWSPGGQSTFYRIPPDQLILFEQTMLLPYFELDLAELAELKPLDEPSEENSMSTNQTPERASFGPLNRILYGPPGTGKTYRSVAEAVSIVEGKPLAELLAPAAYRETKKRFDAYRADGTIEFVTFHPSYAYQDFVEGIRPLSTPEGGLTYDVEPGVLKRIAVEARSNWEATSGSGATGISESERFERAFSQLLANIEEAKDGSVPAKLYRGTLADVTVGARERGLTLIPQGYPTKYPLARHHIKALWMRREEVRTPRDTKLDNGSFFWAALRLLEEVDAQLPSPQSSERARPKRYVLIIDEINRGSIAKILGELITLIEDDKRLGALNEMTARLPYTPEERPFGLPPNLYLLGTMNTADRSVVLMDTALRRRFSFVEMMPQVDTLPEGETFGVDLRRLLKSINRRIEFLFDREHTIGHSYLCNIESFSDIAHSLATKVITRLQAYLY